MAASMPRSKTLKSLFKSVLFHSKLPCTCTYQKRSKTYKSFNVEFSDDTGEGRRLNFEIGNLAKIADGAVVTSLGDTSVLVAVTSRKEMSTAAFLPLTVDYRQKSAAAGRIPTNHLRRELGATDKEILTSRVIDRSLRSTFPDNYFYDTQITCNLLSVDGVNDPDVISINGASAALAMSDIPWNGPVGAVRVGHIESCGFIVNPTRKQQQQSDMNVIIVTDQQANVLMLEGEANIMDYSKFNQGILFGARNATKIATQIASHTKYTPKRSWKSSVVKIDEDILEDVNRVGAADVNEVLYDKSHDKTSRDDALQKCRFNIANAVAAKYSEEKQAVHEGITKVIKRLFRNQIVYDNKRCDGRDLSEIRPISSCVDLYKPLHGSALFTRGQTQVLSTLTFDSLQNALKVDPISVLTGEMKEKNFMLHYEFPPYATNEIRNPGIKNRRELGHGNLAERGLKPIIPQDLPFSVRLTAEVLESNGSSSMASICAGSLALMDAGVAIKEPAAGVAMGLMYDSNGPETHTLLTDILGIEDYMGDMDLKIGGTRSGLTAIQMDLKIPGISLSVVEKAIMQAKAAIHHVLGRMKETSGLSEPRSSLKPNGPVAEKIQVLPANRAAFTGVGGINLKKLRAETGVTITSLDESTFDVFACNSEAMTEAKELMKGFAQKPREPVLEFNAVYEAKIVELRNNGVMVQLHPAMAPTLLPNSQLDHRRVAHPSALGLTEGQMITVKYFGRDPTTGYHRISRKVITQLSSKQYKLIEEE